MGDDKHTKQHIASDESGREHANNQHNTHRSKDSLIIEREKSAYQLTTNIIRRRIRR